MADNLSSQDASLAASHSRVTLRSVTKVLGRGRHRYYVLRGVNAVFEASRHYVILGAQGAGKTTLLRVLSGMQRVGGGSIERLGKVMPPLGMAHIYSEGATGKELCKIFAQLFDADAHAVIEYTTAFSGLGALMNVATIDLPAEMRFRLSLSLGYAVPADFYLFDGFFALGSPAFREKCSKAFEQRSRSAGTIFATRDLRRASQFGDVGVVIHNARLHMFSTVEEAVYTCRYLALEQKHGTLVYAEELLANGDKEGARDYLNESGLLNDGNAAAYELSAQVAAALGDEAGVERWALQALSVDRERAFPHLLLAQAASRRAAFDEAKMHAEAYLAIEPDHREARRILAQAYEGCGQFGPAARVWSNFYAREKNAVAFRMAIRCSVRAAEWESVLELLNQSPVSENDAAMAEFKLAALIGLGRTEEIKVGLLALARREPERALTLICRQLPQIGEATVGEIINELDLTGLTGGVALQRLRLINAQLVKAALRTERENGPGAGVAIADAADRLSSVLKQPPGVAPS